MRFALLALALVLALSGCSKGAGAGPTKSVAESTGCTATSQDAYDVNGDHYLAARLYVRSANADCTANVTGCADTGTLHGSWSYTSSFAAGTLTYTFADAAGTSIQSDTIHAGTDQSSDGTPFSTGYSVHATTSSNFGGGTANLEVTCPKA